MGMRPDLMISTLRRRCAVFGPPVMLGHALGSYRHSVGNCAPDRRYLCASASQNEDHEIERRREEQFKVEQEDATPRPKRKPPREEGKRWRLQKRGGHANRLRR